MDARPIYLMKNLRYDYHVYYWSPKANPLCHFYFDEFRPVDVMERAWKDSKIDAYVMKVVDQETGQVLYERAKV